MHTYSLTHNFHVTAVIVIFTDLNITDTRITPENNIYGTVQKS